MKTLEELFQYLENKLEETKLIDLIEEANEYCGDDWKEYIKFSDVGYQRKLVFRGKNVEILILSWKKGQRSKVHDHPKNGCILKVLKGILKEQRYCKEKLDVMEKTMVKKGDISYIDNSKCYHDVEGVEDSVSLHIYSPPNYCPKYFDCCK